MDWVKLNDVYTDRAKRERAFEAWKIISGNHKKVNFDEAVYKIGLKIMAKRLGV